MRTMRERMGSGGPRGLQIPRSGASSVRGRFDSYAFPPLLALALAVVVGALVGASPALAQKPGSYRDVPATPDTVAAPAVEAAPESLALAPLDTTAMRRARVRHWSDQPRLVMLRSLVVPGWGQLHNRAWVKAVLVAGGETALGLATLSDWKESNRLYDRSQEVLASSGEGSLAYATAVAEYNARLDRLTQREWLLGVMVVYAMVDAYVDANFRGFDIEFKQDPALPEGFPRSTTARISYRWAF